MTTQTIGPEQLASDFETMMKGKMEDDALASAVKSIATTTQKYGAHGSIASLLFYMKIQVAVKGGKTFNGNAGGIAFPGGGANFGDVYTSDLNKLYAETESFAFTSTPVYFAVYFFDKNHNSLGTYQSGAVSTASGAGGGSGSWS